MKRFKVKNEKSGASFTINDGRELIGDIQPEWGKPDRWVRAEQEDVTGAIETRDVTLLDGTVVKEYHLPAEYEIVEEDITQQVEQDRINNESLAYLASTDWYAVRFAETGVAIPDDIKAARAAARAAIVRS